MLRDLVEELGLDAQPGDHHAPVAHARRGRRARHAANGSCRRWRARSRAARRGRGCRGGTRSRGESNCSSSAPATGDRPIDLQEVEAGLRAARLTSARSSPGVGRGVGAARRPSPSRLRRAPWRRCAPASSRLTSSAESSARSTPGSIQRSSGAMPSWSRVKSVKTSVGSSARASSARTRRARSVTVSGAGVESGRRGSVLRAGRRRPRSRRPACGARSPPARCG